MLSVALSGFVQDDKVTAFGGADGVKEALAAGRVPGPSGGTWPLSDVRLLAPVPEPGTIYAIGLNYADHIAESGALTPAPLLLRLSRLPKSAQAICTPDSGHSSSPSSTSLLSVSAIRGNYREASSSW